MTVGAPPTMGRRISSSGSAWAIASLTNHHGSRLNAHFTGFQESEGDDDGLHSQRRDPHRHESTLSISQLVDDRGVG